MTDYVKRLIYVDNRSKIKINPLFYPFLLATFAYGLGFTAFPWWSGVNSSSLFSAMSAIQFTLPHLWGIFALLAGIFAMILVLFRRGGWLGETAAMFGFLVWLFAGIVYALGGYWMVFLSVTGPNMYFWGWYYIRVKWYERQKAAGHLVDPD